MGSNETTDVTMEGVIPLLTPLKFGEFELSHRVVLPSLTRCRSPENLIGKAAIQYYSQRATPGGFLITEATVAAPNDHKIPFTPGIYTKEQIEAWKPVVKAVHDKGAIFFQQLWHSGKRNSLLTSFFWFLKKGQIPEHESCGHCAEFHPNRPQPVSDSSKQNDDTPGESSKRQQLTAEEIPLVIDQWRFAARNAIEAGFDGVEIHGGNGYLIDFWETPMNDRTDQYGSQSYENRTRFVLELIDALAAEVGTHRLGLRIRPFTVANNPATSDPIPLGLYLMEELNKRNLLYLHVIEARSTGSPETDSQFVSLPLRQAFKGRFLGVCGFTRDSGNAFIAEGKADLIAFGRHFVSNPDLVKRIALNAPFNDYNRDTFYTNDPVVGYNDYPLLSDSAPVAR